MINFTKKEAVKWATQVYKQFSPGLYDGYASRRIQFPLENCPGVVLDISVENKGFTVHPRIHFRADIRYNGDEVVSKLVSGFNKQIVKDAIWNCLVQFAEVYNALERGDNPPEFAYASGGVDSMIRQARAKKGLIEYISATQPANTPVKNNPER